MRNYININIWLLVIIVLSSSCVNDGDIHLPTNSNLEKISEYISSPVYMQECKKINSSFSSVQVSYQGLIPGKTKEDEIISLVGEPNEILKVNEKTRIDGEIKIVEDQWIYDKFILTVENKIIYDIDVYDQDFIYNPVIEIVREFGCPNIIFVVDVIDTNKEGYDPGEAPFFTLLKYQKIGLEVFFGKYPVSTTDVPERITLRRFETLQDFLSRMSIFQSSVEMNGIISWDNAIIQ